MWRLAAIGLVTVGAAVLPAAAAAAPPANDNFAARQVLPSALPVAVSGSNVEATKEAGESLFLFAAGRSVWFKWEAPASGFVTVDGCGSGFNGEIGVYTGSAVNALNRVADGMLGAGPPCPGVGGEGRRVTFRAMAGTDYEIAVDGNAFFLPGSASPITEGTIALQITPTPTPPNDDFSNAVAMTGTAFEEPGGARPYFSRTDGNNWARPSRRVSLTMGEIPAAHRSGTRGRRRSRVRLESVCPATGSGHCWAFTPAEL